MYVPHRSTGRKTVSDLMRERRESGVQFHLRVSHGSDKSVKFHSVMDTADVSEIGKRLNDSEALHIGRSNAALQHMKAQLESTEDAIYQHFIVHGHAFQSLFTLLTVINAVQMGAEAEYPEWTRVWSICEHVFTAGFTLEMVLKLCFLKKKYFSDRANWLDAVLTVLGIFDCWILPAISNIVVDLQSLSVLRVLRLLRLARILRLVRRFRQLVLVIQGVTKAVSSAVSVFALLFFILYVFAIFCTEYLGRSDTHLYPGFSTDPDVIDELELIQEYNPYVCFGSMMSSMFTLFNMAIGQEWREISRAVAIKQPIVLPILVFFMMLVGLVVLNVLIAVIVDEVIEESREIENSYIEDVKLQKLETLAQIEDVLQHLDSNGDGLLDTEEMSKALEKSNLLKGLVQSINLPPGWTPTELLDMLDSKGTGSLHYSEFTTGFFRLLNGDDFQQICIMASSINQVKKMIRQQGRRFEAMHSAMQADIAAIKAAVRITANIEEQLGSNQATQGTSVERQTESTSLCGANSVKPRDQQSNSVCKEELVGPTFPASQTPWEDMLRTRMRLEETLRDALVCVKDLINEELSATKQGIELERTCSDPPSFHSVPIEFPAGKPRRQPPPSMHLPALASRVPVSSKGVAPEIGDLELSSGVEESVLTSCSLQNCFSAHSKG